MSNEQNPRSCWKFNRNTDKASCAGASCQGQTKEDHSSKTTDKIHNVFGREPIKNWSKDYLQGSIVEAGKHSESVAERDTQRNSSSWQTVEICRDSFLSRSNEATSGRNIHAEAGNFPWRRGNAMEQRNSQTVWDLKTTSPEACESKRLLGINENLPEDLKERYFWKPRESVSQKMYENSKERSSQSTDAGSPVGVAGSQASYRMVKNCENYSWRLETSSPLDRTPTFANLALDVSYAGLDTSGFLDIETSRKSEADVPEYWEDLSVVECLGDKSSSCDGSTPEERVQALKEVLAETDIHEGDGIVSDFLFHVARTKYGKIYIRVIRTLLLNRGRICMIYAIDRIGLAV